MGLGSSGLHTNGYTLARKIVFDQMGLRADDEMPELERPVGDVLLDVHRSYLNVLWPLLQEERIHALAHVTGGGIPGNLPRVAPGLPGPSSGCSNAPEGSTGTRCTGSSTWGRV